jgi:hypothetical protein
VAKLYDQSLTLELLTWIGTLTHLPIVVKGILRGDSAALAASHPNVRAIIVSNHGGRQLDNWYELHDQNRRRWLRFPYDSVQSIVGSDHGRWCAASRRSRR